MKRICIVITCQLKFGCRQVSEQNKNNKNNNNNKQKRKTTKEINKNNELRKNIMSIIALLPAGLRASSY